MGATGVAGFGHRHLYRARADRAGADNATGAIHLMDKRVTGTRIAKTAVQSALWGKQVHWRIHRAVFSDLRRTQARDTRLEPLFIHALHSLARRCATLLGGVRRGTCVVMVVP